GYGDGQDTGLHNVPQGSTLVSEAGHGTTNGTDYNSSVSCSSNNGSKGSESGTSHTFTANYGDVITCTFTNNRLPRLKLAKTVNPGTDTGTFDLTDPSPSSTLSRAGYGDGQDTGLHNVPQGSTLVSEA